MDTFLRRPMQPVSGSELSGLRLLDDEGSNFGNNGQAVGSSIRLRHHFRFSGYRVLQKQSSCYMRKLVLSSSDTMKIIAQTITYMVRRT
jgi:hypothetical protein